MFPYPAHDPIRTDHSEFQFCFFVLTARTCRPMLLPYCIAVDSNHYMSRNTLAFWHFPLIYAVLQKR